MMEWFLGLVGGLMALTFGLFIAWRVTSNKTVEALLRICGAFFVIVFMVLFFLCADEANNQINQKDFNNVITTAEKESK